ncbi:MAG TPA: hypothetical protein VGE12_05990 [Noviherbaspirillum sp.]
MTLTADLSRTYGTSHRDTRTNQPAANEKRTDKHSTEALAHAESRTSDRSRRLVCALGMIVPVATILAMAAWYIAL